MAEIPKSNPMLKTIQDMSELFKAFKQMEDVIGAAARAEQILQEFEKKKAEIDAFPALAEEERLKFEKKTKEYRNGYYAAMDGLEAQKLAKEKEIEEVKQKLFEVRQEVSQAEKDGEAVKRKIRDETAALTAEFDKTKASFEQWKKAHGLG